MKSPRAEEIRPLKRPSRRNEAQLRERGEKRLGRVCRRQRAACALKEAARGAIVGTAEAEVLEEQLWDVIALFAGYAFRTAKGLKFSYALRGNEMFVDRKDKSITRATVNLAARTAFRLQRECGGVRGPKKLGTFGASYLYPVFIRIGVILPPGEIALPLCAMARESET